MKKINNEHEEKMTEINNNFTLNNKEIGNKHTEEIEKIKNDTRKIENDYLNINMKH